MEIYISKFTAKEIDEAVEKYKTLSLSKYELVKSSVLLVSDYETSTVDNPEWSEVIVDADDKIIAGIKQDNSAYTFDM